MNSADWWSQPMRPEGDSTGAGIETQLGKPDLGNYEILVREAAQNSWDARRAGTTVSFTIALNRLGDRADYWRRIFGGSNLPGLTGETLASLSADSLILRVSDRGTKGLGGPIRSDRIATEKGNDNFVQFIRNVGESRDTPLGGGTYGYGKAAFFMVSSSSVILVDTLNSDNDDMTRRLMGAALTEAFVEENTRRRFTGRHWWGTINDGIPDPLIGEDAEDVSRKLGLPGFADGETGTDIIVLLPKLGIDDPGEDLSSLGERLRGHIYWNLWPKFPTAQRPGGMNFRVEVNGQPLEMPGVESVPIIREFAAALDEIANHKGKAFRLKKYGPIDLGEMAITPLLNKQISLSDKSVEAIFRYCPFDRTKPLSHVARMRQAELIVDYRKCVPLPSADLGYVSVFRAGVYSDEAFSNSEPPTHHDWVTKGLTGDELGIVRGSNQFITRETEKFANSRFPARSKTVEGLGRLSNELGGYLPSGSGTRADGTGLVKRSQVNRRLGPSRKFKLLGSSYIAFYKGDAVVEARVALRFPENEKFALLPISEVLLANNQREKPNNAPAGWEAPRFIGWFTADGSDLISGREMLTDEDSWQAEMLLRFEFLPDTALIVSVKELNV